MWDENKKNVFFGLTTAYPCSVTHPCPNVFQKNDDDDEADDDDGAVDDDDDDGAANNIHTFLCPPSGQDSAEKLGKGNHQD